MQSAVPSDARRSLKAVDIDDRWYRVEKGRKVRSKRYGQGRRYDARWRDLAGQQRHKSFTMRGQAEAFLAQLRAELDRGTYIDPSAGKVSFKTYAEDWRKHQAHRPTTATRTETILRLHVYPYLGDLSMGSIRSTHIRGWVKGLEDKLAPSTVKNLHGIVAGIFLAATDDHVIAVSPFTRKSGRGVGYLPEASRDKIVPPTSEQVEAVVSALPDRWRALVLLSASTGLRISEALGLSVDPKMPHRVDLMRARVHVARSLGVQNDRRWLGPPKTQAGYRTVPLPEAAKAALVQHLATYPAVSVQLHDSVERVDIQPRLVFTGARGGVIRRSGFTGDAWAKATEAAGCPEMRFHDLRHFYASLLIRHGESVKTVQKNLGHASAAETLDTYSHLWHDSDDRTRAAVDSVFSSAPDVRQAQVEGVDQA